MNAGKAQPALTAPIRKPASFRKQVPACCAAQTCNARPAGEPSPSGEPAPSAVGRVVLLGEWEVRDDAWAETRSCFPHGYHERGAVAGCVRVP